MHSRHRALNVTFLYTLLLLVPLTGLGTEHFKLDNAPPERIENLQPWLGNYRTYPEPDTIPSAPAGCQLLHINHLGRHGSRYPLKSGHVQALISEFESLVESRPLTQAGNQLRHNINRMGDWYRNNPQAMAQLTHKGINEALSLGQRTARMLQQETRHSRPISIATGSTLTDRTQQSLQMFQDGVSQVLGDNLHPTIHPILPKEKMDALLSPFSHCPRLDQTLNPRRRSASADYINRLNSTHPEIADPFSDHLLAGLPTEKSIRLAINVFQLCRLENPMNRSFGICSTFMEGATDDRWQTLVQWLGDVINHLYYYKMGPAVVMDNIQSTIGMPILQHFLDVTGSAARGDEDIRAHFRFAHDVTLAELLQSIGVIKTRGTDKERYLSWNSSRQLPMAANLYWQLYECRNGLKIRMLLNENVEPFPFPPCHKQALCDWKSVQQHYRHADYQDKMKAACSMDGHSHQQPSARDVEL